MSIDESQDLASRKLRLELIRVRQAEEAARLAARAAEIELLLLEQFAQATNLSSATAPEQAEAERARAPLVSVDPLTRSTAESSEPRERPSGTEPGANAATTADPNGLQRATESLIEAIRRLASAAQESESVHPMNEPVAIVAEPIEARRHPTAADPAAALGSATDQGWETRLERMRSRPSDAPVSALVTDTVTTVEPRSETASSQPQPTTTPSRGLTRVDQPDFTASHSAATGAGTAVEQSGGENQTRDKEREGTGAAPTSPAGPVTRATTRRPAALPSNSTQPARSPRVTGPALVARQASNSADWVLSEAHTPPAGKRARPAAWLISFLGHVALVLGLGLFTLSLPQPRDQVAISAAAAQSVESPLETFTVSSPEELSVSEPHEVSLDALEAETSPMGELQGADISVDLAFSPRSPVAEGLPNASAMDLASSQLQVTSDNRVQFAGIDGGGNHFVYLVDSSNSMRNFNEARAELLRSIESLREDQRFYVIFYDQQPDYMRLTNAGQDESTSVRASPAAKLALRRWAMTITQERGKSPVEVLEFALSLRPDVIFLLSDGEFSMRTEEVIRERNRRENLFGDSQLVSIIHTIRYPGYSVTEARKAEQQMRRIAEDNGGQYRNVEIR